MYIIGDRMTIGPFSTMARSFDRVHAEDRACGGLTIGGTSANRRFRVGDEKVPPGGHRVSSACAGSGVAGDGFSISAKPMRSTLRSTGVTRPLSVETAMLMSA